MLEEVRFRSRRGRVLAGVLHHPQGTAPTTAVVVAHGMLSSKASAKHVAVCERAAAAGALALRFDFAGRGGSEGTPSDLTVSGECADLEGALDAVAARGLSRTLLVGSSLGGSVAVLTAARRDVAGLVTIAAPVSLPRSPRTAWGETHADADGTERFADGTPLPIALFADAPKHDIAAAASAVQCPWLVIQGDRDAVVPPGAARELAARGHRTRLVVHPAADHAFTAGPHLEWLLDTVARFLQPAIAGRDPFADNAASGGG